jgi:protein subunit release factor B
VISIPASSLTWRFSHGTGPGGQVVNTTDSRAALGDRLRIVVSSNRSQLRNREGS